MTKNIKFFLACLTIVLLTVVLVWTVGYAQSGALGLSAADEDEIKDVVENYFEIRYRALSMDQPEDLPGITSKFSSDSSSLKPELEKLEVEIQHAKKYHLLYSKYNLLLEFIEISFDPITQIVSVSVIEGHDVVFEISEELSKTKPIISSMRNLQHILQIRKEQDGWKIISDNYNDYLWRLIKATGLSNHDLIQYMRETPANIIQPQMMTTQLDQDEMACSLPSDDVSIHSYNRNGAIDYASRWATAPRPYNHPPYDDYTDLGGDCTNFVSQAIHEGGNAEMVFGGSHGIGTLGWYYYSANDRASAWNNVGALRDFIVEYWNWDKGPEGCEVLAYEAYEGDLVQYDWEPDSTWNHSVIIVRSEDLGYHNRYHWVAGHTPDTYDYPYSSYIYEYPNMVYRLIHIERIDDFVYIYLPLVIKSAEGEGGTGSVLNPQNNPYPAPIELGETSPYPAPTDNSEYNGCPYPTP